MKPGRCDLIIPAPRPPYPAPDSCGWCSGASLGVWLLSAASNLWSCSYSQSMALLFHQDPLSFLHPRACTGATGLSTMLASQVTTLFPDTWHWIPGILVVVLQRFPGRTRALTSTGPLKQVYLCVLFLSPSPPLPQGLMRKDIWKALVSGDASHIGQELDFQHVSFPHTPHLQSKPVSSSPGLL